MSRAPLAFLQMLSVSELGCLGETPLPAPPRRGQESDMRPGLSFAAGAISPATGVESRTKNPGVVPYAINQPNPPHAESAEPRRGQRGSPRERLHRIRLRRLRRLFSRAQSRKKTALLSVPIVAGRSDFSFVVRAT